MTIEYIELKKDTTNIFWNNANPAMFLDDNLCVPLPMSSIYNYSELTENIKEHSHYCLRNLNKQNLLLEFMPFASRELRDYLNSNNTTNSQVPLITLYSDHYYIYISHNDSAALLKVSSEDVTNDFLKVIDNLYGIR